MARTDASSTEVIASTAFTTTITWSSSISMRDYTDISVWFSPTDLGTNTQVDIFIAWSDDGSTIPEDDYSKQLSDVDIVNQTDGSYNPKSYIARFTTGGGELVVDERRHLTFPKKGGSCRIGVQGNNASGAYSVRTQRLVA